MIAVRSEENTEHRRKTWVVFIGPVNERQLYLSMIFCSKIHTCVDRLQPRVFIGIFANFLLRIANRIIKGYPE